MIVTVTYSKGQLYKPSKAIASTDFIVLHNCSKYKLEHFIKVNPSTNSQPSLLVS